MNASAKSGAHAQLPPVTLSLGVGSFEPNPVGVPQLVSASPIVVPSPLEPGKMGRSSQGRVPASALSLGVGVGVGVDSGSSATTGGAGAGSTGAGCGTGGGITGSGVTTGGAGFTRIVCWLLGLEVPMDDTLWIACTR